MAKRSLESIVFPKGEFTKETKTRHLHWSGSVTVYNYIYKGIPLLLGRLGSYREHFYVGVQEEELYLPIEVYEKLRMAKTNFSWKVDSETQAEYFHDFLVKGLEEILAQFGEYISPDCYKMGGKERAEKEKAESFYKLSVSEAEALCEAKNLELNAKFPMCEFQIHLDEEEFTRGELCRERDVYSFPPCLFYSCRAKYEFSSFNPNSMESLENIDIYIAKLQAAKRDLVEMKRLAEAETIFAVAELKKVVTERADKEVEA